MGRGPAAFLFSASCLERTGRRPCEAEHPGPVMAGCLPAWGRFVFPQPWFVLSHRSELSLTGREGLQGDGAPSGDRTLSPGASFPRAGGSRVVPVAHKES